MKTQTLAQAHSETISSTGCIHCGSFLTSFSARSCCRGCEAVYTLLNERGLQKYYDLLKSDVKLRKPVPAIDPKTSESFSYLDELDFLKLYAWDSTTFPGEKMMEFYLEGVHCAACVWLTEKTPEFIPNVTLVRLNLSDSVATVRVSSGGSFARVAQEFLNMGYRPHPVNRNEGKSTLLQKRENRLLLIQLGVAATCAGNIMLLAISLYAGATGTIAMGFKWISFLLFLPVLTFSGLPFYKSAWIAIRSGRASIDIPIVIGILIGSIVSIIHLIQGYDDIYFDSLSTLMFLLLSTRYLLKKTQQSALNSSHLLHFLTPSYARKLNSRTGSFEKVKLDHIQLGDIIQVKAGECIPVDGITVKGNGSISQALLTGESRPETIQEMNRVFAGTLNLESPLEIQVTYSGSATRLGKILRLMEDSLQKKASWVTFADRISQVFVFSVLLLSAATFLFGLTEGWHEGLNRALAIALVTCPCTFALATPLAFSVTLGRLAKVGILIKGSEVLEKLCKIKTVFLDKTGTLTYGHLQVLEWQTEETFEDKEKTQSAVYQLESLSNHPIAQALVNYLRPQFPLISNHVEQFSETIGKGVSGLVSGVHYEICRNRSLDSNAQVAIYREGKKVASVLIGDEIRKDTVKSIKDLQLLNLRPWILSGDYRAGVLSVAKEIGIPPFSCISEAPPEKKSEIIKSHPRALMVGDGANDAVALASAYVGVAVHSGIEVSMRAADVYFCTPGVRPLAPLISISRETLKVIHRNFVFSIFYNFIFGIAAVLGKISPLFAAVLMPMSALTVFLSSIAGTRKMRKAFLELGL